MHFVEFVFSMREKIEIPEYDSGAIDKEKNR